VSHFYKPTPKKVSYLETPNKHHWQEALALASLIDDEKKFGDCQFDLWKQYYVVACVAVFSKLRRSRCLDADQSGCTALSIFKQGDLMIVANACDSRVVLGTASDNGVITPSSSSST
jgi:NADH:ubiquinone oxidoreductase subunit B-like Fe-S oxidoreductase